MIIKKIILTGIMIITGQKVRQWHMNSYSNPATMVQNC